MAFLQKPHNASPKKANISGRVRKLIDCPVDVYWTLA